MIRATAPDGGRSVGLLFLRVNQKVQRPDALRRRCFPTYFPCILGAFWRIQFRRYNSSRLKTDSLTFACAQGGALKRSHLLLCILLCLALSAGKPALAQDLASSFVTQPSDPASTSQQPSASSAQEPPAAKATPDPAPNTAPKTPLPDSPQPKVQPDEEAQQTKRILWIIPNFRSVTANTYLPPLSFKEKVWLATQDSFDYSAFVWVGMVSGLAMGTKSEPSFGQGASGYGVYYAHNLADNTIENYLVEAIVPAATKQDPRYYTLGHGGFFKRTGYSVSRLFITRTDAGNSTVNVSEIVGAGAAAGIGNLYYPSNNNQWVKTYQRWGSQLIQDGLGNILKEFWPEINRAVFHSKY